MRDLKIPSDWQRVRLKELAKIQTGVAKGQKNIQDPVKLPYLRVANVQDGFLDLSEVKEVMVDRSKVKRYLLEPEDVLLTEGGDFDKLGRGTIWREELPKCLHQNHVFAVRTNPKKLDAAFFSLQAGSPYGKWYFQSCAKQTTNLASINSSQLKDFSVILPSSIEEQKEIAKILSAWDKSILLMEELVAAKGKRKEGLMQCLLTGQLRFPGFEDEWLNFKVKDVFARVKRKNSEGNENILTASAQHGLINQTEFFNKSVAGKNLENYYLLERNEFAYNRSSSAGYPYGAIKRLDNYEKGVLSTLYICFCLKDDTHNSDFLVHLFESGGLDRGIYKIAQEGARNHGLLNVSVSDFFDLPIVLPPRDEQDKIAEVLNLLDQEINLLKQKLSSLKIQKRGLMQRLLTGQVRVRVEEEVAVATIEVPTHNIEWNLNILAKLNGNVPVETRLSGSEPVYQSQPIHHLVEYLRTKLKINRLMISGNVSWDVVDGRRQIEVNLTIETFTETGKEKEELVSFLERNIPKVVPKYIKMNSPQEETDLMEQLFRLRRDLHEV